MNSKIILGLIGLIIAYFAIKYFAEKDAPKIQTNPYTDILTSNKYKVKGQWDKE